jgi:hypothetical protein
LIPASAQNAPSQQQTVSAKLICGPHSANPEKLRDFQANIVFTLSQGQLQAKRTLRGNGGGQEVFKGTVSPTGAILVSGKGFFKNGGTWVYEFTGNRNETDDTTLQGELSNTSGSVGSRSCQLVFFKPRAL